MKLLKKIFNKITIYIYYIFSILKLFFVRLIYKKRVYIFGIPIHGNLGDHAILEAEKKILHDYTTNIKVVEVESGIIEKFGNLVKNLIGKSTILITGGGFLGSLWMNEENMFRKTLKMFPNNIIIVMPQTIYFSNNKEGKRILNESKKIYSAHKNLYICCREKFSYDFMINEFPKCRVLLVPDMVLYLNGITNQDKKQNVLFCIRRDKEKINYNYNELKSNLSKFQIDYTDTVIPENVYSFNRKRKLYKKIQQFSNYKLIVTDRLHGMVLALLSGTPCLVFENKSYKVKGVYQWIKNIDSVRLYDEDSLSKDINELLQIDDIKYDNEQLNAKFSDLIDLIKQNIL